MKSYFFNFQKWNLRRFYHFLFVVFLCVTLALLLLKGPHTRFCLVRRLVWSFFYGVHLVNQICSLGWTRIISQYKLRSCISNTCFQCFRVYQNLMIISLESLYFHACSISQVKRCHSLYLNILQIAYPTSFIFSGLSEISPRRSGYQFECRMEGVVSKQNKNVT